MSTYSSSDLCFWSADCDGSINMFACLALSLYHTSFDRFVVVVVWCLFNSRTCQHPLSIQESADSSGARNCQNPSKAWKSVSNFSEPTCKAATRFEEGLAKPKLATSPKPKPAASIEQSSRSEGCMFMRSEQLYICTVLKRLQNKHSVHSKLILKSEKCVRRYSSGGAPNS